MDSKLDLTPEHKQAWRKLTPYVEHHCVVADGWLIDKAGRLKAEFERDHHFVEYVMGELNDGDLHCIICGANADPRHNYTDEQWLEAARKELEG